jgi:2-haloacid dehalogenase
MQADDWDVLTFDCYGTLVDWEAGLGAALENLLRPHGVAAPRDELLTDFGRLEAEAEAGDFVPYREVLALVAERLGRHHGVELTAAERQCLGTSLPDWPLFPDTVPALRRLAGRYRLGILSNIDDDLFAGTAEHLGVTFEPVVTAQQVGSYKPAHANFTALLERVGVPSERLLHVAQSLFHDVAPAAAMGLRTVWVDRRGGAAGGATPAASATPDYRVPDLATLADLLCALESGASSPESDAAR